MNVRTQPHKFEPERTSAVTCQPTGCQERNRHLPSNVGEWGALCWEGGFPSYVQFLRHEKTVRLHARVAFGDGEYDGDFCRFPLVRGLEHLNLKPVHRVRRQVIHPDVVLPQESQLSIDPRVHGYPRLKQSFLPKDTPGRNLITSSGASVTLVLVGVDFDDALRDVPAAQRGNLFGSDRSGRGHGWNMSSMHTRFSRLSPKPFDTGWRQRRLLIVGDQPVGLIPQFEPNAVRRRIDASEPLQHMASAMAHVRPTRTAYRQ